MTPQAAEGARIYDMPRRSVTRGRRTEKPHRPSPVTVVIVDDHRLFAEALAMVLEPSPDVEVAGVVTDPASAVDVITELRPSVAIVDLVLGSASGLDLIDVLATRAPDTRCIVVSAVTAEQAMTAAVRSGALGFVTKDAPIERLVSAIRTAARGERVPHRPTGTPSAGSPESALLSRLTPREVDVLRLLVQGRSGKEMGKALSIRQNTVRTHIQNVLMKLHVHSRLEAMGLAVRAGMRADVADVRSGASTRGAGHASGVPRIRRPSGVGVPGRT